MERERDRENLKGVGDKHSFTKRHTQPKIYIYFNLTYTKYEKKKKTVVKCSNN